ncbi:phage baseplate assembly protein V [Acidiphilium sp.]|uniref:phage baseplate assembly protein V n=1 Tax=Acidiphilium sp. TaxID=527 RepID=UPI002CCD1566|nr:phage baseplate assembly protein V [Acidiphilium sp.]HQT62778.1 phage baseplate assembly protein V [Acidiphilium sp.]
MDAFQNGIRRLAAGMDRQIAAARIGIVTSVNPGPAYQARAQIQPNGVETGWCPVAVQWVGAGWGLVSPPLPGDQVVLLPMDGDPAAFVIVGRLYSAQSTPAVDAPAAPAGELWIVHETGSFLKLLTDGSISSQGTWNHAGAFNATDEITAKAGTSTSVTLTGHRHTQGNDSHGDTEEDTSAPIAGT